MLKKYSAFLWLAATLIVIVLASLKRSPESTGIEYSPNMYYPVGYEPMSQIDKHPLNPMGMNMRLPAKGTVARRNYATKFGVGDSTSTDLMLYDVPADSIGIAERTLKNPVPLNDKSLAEGKELYERFCQHCHGENGKGDGLVGKVYAGVPVYSSDALKSMNDGHIFHVITNGKGRMWAHGSQMNPLDRWKIVHYVHKLQQEE